MLEAADCERYAAAPRDRARTRPSTMGDSSVMLVAREQDSLLSSDVPQFEQRAETFCDEVVRFLNAANRADPFAGQYIYSIVRVTPGAAQHPEAPVQVLHQDLYSGDLERARSLVAAAAFDGAILDVSLRRVGGSLEHKRVQITSPSH